MENYPQERPATTRRFRIWINGRLSDGFADGIDGVDQDTVGGRTVLTGILVDQAQLYGVMDRLRRLGIDIERFETFPASEPAQRRLSSEKEEQRTMDPNVIIRDETSADIGAITEVTVTAFRTLEISNNTEQFIIMALRAAKALAVSLVAELDGRVIGHLAFSPVTISDGTPNWYGLGPVSVLPEYHRHGIGTALIEEGLARLANLDAAGCCVVGHPDYYGRFGFENTAELVHEGVPREAFFVRSFDGHIPRGTVTFPEAFE